MDASEALIATALEQFLARILQDCLSEATSRYWLKRAATFEAARPQPGDWPGLDPDPGLDARLAATAQACRSHAQLVGADHPW